MKNVRWFGLVGALAVGWVVACGGSEDGGSGPTGSAGKAAAGSAGKASAGSAGSTSGGAAGSTSGGAAGSTSGGAAGSTSGGAAGSTSGGKAGSAGGKAAPPPSCDAPKVSVSGGKCFTRGKGAGSTGSSGAGGSAAGAGGSAAGAGGDAAGAGGSSAGAAGAGGDAAGAGGSGGVPADPTCGGFFDPQNITKCDECFRGSCCGAVEACEADKTCKACLSDSPPSSCSSNALLDAIVKCGTGAGALEDEQGNLSGMCAAECDSRCNPVTNDGCDPGSTCDFADTSSGFACYPPPNEAALCAACDNSAGPFCQGGMACLGGKCARFCCDDSDCGTGKCDKSLFEDDEVGACVAK